MVIRILNDKYRILFVITTIIFTLYNSLGQFFLYSPGGCDYWEHLATIFSFSRNLLYPDNPYILSNQPTHLFTPYHLFWGIISKIFKIHPFYILPCIAIINSLLFMLASKYISSFLLKNEKFFIIFFIVLLFFWYKPWAWSGFYNFALLPLTIIYPYWFAFPFSIIILSRYHFRENIFHVIILSFIFSLIFLVHPLTFIFIFLSYTVKLTLEDPPILKIYFYFLVLMLASIISLLWPYFSVSKAILNSAHYKNIGFAGCYWLFYKNIPSALGPALFGLIPLLYFVINFSKNNQSINFIVYSFFIFLFLYVLNYVLLHNSLLSRLIIYLVFFLHISIVVIVINRKKLLITSLALLILFAPIQLKESLKRVHIFDHSTNFNLLLRYSFLGKYIKSRDVVLSPLNLSWILPSIIGCKVVGVLHSNPFFTDYFERLKENKIFFSKQCNLKCQLDTIRKYKVNFIVVKKDEEKYLKQLVLKGYLYKIIIKNDLLLYKVALKKH